MFVKCEDDFAMVWILPRAELEIKTWFDMVSLENNHKKQQWEWREWDRKIINSIKACYEGALLSCWCWQWELNLARTSERGVFKKRNARNLMEGAINFCPAVGSESEVDVHHVPPSALILDFLCLQGEHWPLGSMLQWPNSSSLRHNPLIFLAFVRLCLLSFPFSLKTRHKAQKYTLGNSHSSKFNPPHLHDITAILASYYMHGR